MVWPYLMNECTASMMAVASSRFMVVGLPTSEGLENDLKHELPLCTARRILGATLKGRK
jgi:hypothetical protein